jgi:hypothetical protein
MAQAAALNVQVDEAAADPTSKHIGLGGEVTAAE